MTVSSFVRNAATSGGNLVRSLRREGLAAIALRLDGDFPELPPPEMRLPFPVRMLLRPTRRANLADVRGAVEMLEQDGRVRSVVMLLGSLRADMASLYTLRQQVMRLRNAGKRVIGWLPSGEMGEYYLASACDEVVLAPPGRLAPLGLRAEVVFLRDALALAGIEADLEAIAEYKVAPDTFRRASMTEPHRHMLDSILDSYFEHMVTSIADGRGIQPDRVRSLVDKMPMDSEQALTQGLVDAVLYEDELPARVAAGLGPVGAEGGGADGSGTRHEAAPMPLTSWSDAARWLRRPTRPDTRAVVGVVEISGLMTPGRSWRSPVPLPLPFAKARAGAVSVAQAIRQAEAMRRIAALILVVDTPGGSALAADLISREVLRLRQRKPVVVLMGAQATSGGYYVAAAGTRIVARPTTMTGSIGVWGGKFVVGGLLAQARVGTGAVQKGAMAGLYSPLKPFDDAERAQVRRELGETYARFVRAVAQGRGLDEATVEDMAKGRVWTGAQARGIGLVDRLGDFETALELVRDLLGIKPGTEVPCTRIEAPQQALMPLPYPSGEEETWGFLGALQALSRERVWALAPWIVRVGS